MFVEGGVWVYVFKTVSSLDKGCFEVDWLQTAPAEGVLGYLRRAKRQGAGSRHLTKLN